MSSYNIVRATDIDASISTLVASFVTDPLQRWMYPTAHAYLSGFPEFAAAVKGPAFNHDMTWQIGDGAAVSIWLPPGVHANVDDIIAALASTVASDRLDQAMDVGEQIGAAHPQEPHWYLTWLAVDPARQNEGIGSRLLEHGLQIVDQSGLPAYLESSSDKNLPFYQRHGFEIVGQTRTANAPSAYFMCRRARA